MATKSSKKYLNYQSALAIGESLKERLEPLCQPDKCRFAGSLRRRADQVGDIEIVCIPKIGKVIPKGEIVAVKMNMVIHHIFKFDSRLADDPRYYTIKKSGPRFTQVLFLGMQCDIYMTSPEQWGRMLALRTGPEAYSIKLASRWCDLGYKGHEGELVSLDGKRRKPSFPTEESFFEFLEWKYIKPGQRR